MGKTGQRVMLALPKTIPTVTWLAITIIQTIFNITLTIVMLSSFGDVFATLVEGDSNSQVPVYFAIFIIAHVFQLGMSFDALAAKNTIQMLGLLVFNTALLAEGIIMINRTATLPRVEWLGFVIWLIPGMIGLTEITYLATIWPIYREFGWQIYKKIGASRDITAMFKWYQVFLCLGKFDFFHFLAFLFQLVFLVQQTDVERWLTIAALPCTVAFLVVGYFAVRKEIPSLFFLFLAGCDLGVAYFAYKIAQIDQNRDTDYAIAAHSLTLFAALSLSLLVATIITSIICYRRFGKGLRKAMDKSDDSEKRLMGEDSLNLQESRMTLE